jgi:hypothetical protein
MYMRRHRSNALPEHKPNDITLYEPIKYVGILAAQYLTPSNSSEIQRQGMAMYHNAGAIMRPDKSILDIHLRPGLKPEEFGGQAFRASLKMLAEYTTYQAGYMHPDEIIGVTDPALGRIATHFGFEMHAINANSLPEVILNRIAQSIGDRRRTLPDGMPSPEFRPGHILNQRLLYGDAIMDTRSLVVVHQDMATFAQNFGSTTNPTA